jgi:hypothetical protein
MEELMCNVALDVLLQRRNKGFNNFKMLDETFFTRSVKSVIRSTWYCG